MRPTFTSAPSLLADLDLGPACDAGMGSPSPAERERGPGGEGP